MTKEFTISYKGYMPSIETDSQLNKTYADIEYGYGTLKMTGTDDQLSALISDLRKESPGINIVGVDW